MSKSSPSLTQAIPAQMADARRWRVHLNGELLRDVRHVVIEHPLFGMLSYGLTAGGYDGCSFHERGGGGSVVLPFAVMEGELWVGLVEQIRPHQGGLVLNAPRGYLDPGEEHATGARRELLEEMGLDVPEDALIRLPGAPANPNSAFYETSSPGEGVHFFALRIPPSYLLHRNGERPTLATGLVADDDEARQNRIGEQIGRSVFVPWHEAATLGDMFTNAAVARLLAARHRGLLQ